MLKNKKILLCLCGGIAVYKCVELASLLIKSGAIVKIIMTKSAMEFVTPLTFRSITKDTVSHKMFDTEAAIEHISLADWADIIAVVPATANIIGKLASGIADDLLTATFLATNVPKLIVPAMNVKMYENPILQENLEKLKRFGCKVLLPESGRLACGYVGQGRMPEVEEIFYAIKTYLFYENDLSGKRILITAGASIEKIDPMRHITNISSGKMGIALARAAFLRGAEVTLVHSSITEKIPYFIESYEKLSAAELYEYVMSIYKDFDIVIMCAAVADYTPKIVSEQKIKKSGELTLELKRTVDILEELGQKKDNKQFLIGFAAESENITQNALLKLEKKKLDMIIANDLSMAGKDDSEIVIIKKQPSEATYINAEKFALAHKILDEYLKC